MPLDISDAVESAANADRFKDMAEAAVGIGYEPGEFLAELAKRSGFKEHVHGWARGKIPNGLACKIILTQAEIMIRERGASPEESMREAA